MNANRFQDNKLLEDENEDVGRAADLSLQESKAKKTYTGDAEFSSIDEVEELAQALEESTLSSTDQLSTSTGGRELKWWKLFKELNPVVHSSRSTSERKGSKQRENPACDVCGEEICSDWLRCTFWGQTCCEKHTSDGTPQCCSCSRFKIGDMKYVTLNDGRQLCPDCHYTAVMSPEECEPLLKDVKAFFKGLNMKVSKYIPILLVDEKEMSKIDEKTSLGLTIYDRSILDVVTFVSMSKQRREKIQVKEEEERLYEGNKVKAILVLYGFPKLALGATLAHEMMHAWMMIQGYEGLSLPIAEGICEVMAHEWLNRQFFRDDDTSEKVQFLRKLKEFLKDGIEKRHCTVYGDGFRKAKSAVGRYGLGYTLKNLFDKKRLPG